ncbi:MAG: hypothetical protein R3196_02100 [Pseudidiomarina sp.]|nr:hypothetical protein [Pseudidiomarina sp.]MDX1705223.1 hypothetical protein [Pseudidiomarina sp.]
MPADQSFATGQQTAIGINDRLVIHPELVLFQARYHLMVKGNVLFGALAQVFIKKVDAERAGRLGCIHGQLRQLDQLLHRSGVLRKYRNTNTGRHINMVMLNIKGIEQVAHDGFGAHFGLRRFIDITQYHSEFITANPGQQIIFADTAADSLCYMLQQFITDSMAEGVINVAQLVKVKNEHRKLLFMAGTDANSLFQLLLKVVAIGQISQGIETRLIANSMQRAA